MVVNLTYLVWVTSARYKHSGRVCSGDYLYTDASTEGYLLRSGNWLEFYAIGTWIMLITYISIHVILTCQ